MHENNIVHRDIKPENIYLDNNYNAFFGDFGESIIYDENENIGYDINVNMFSLPNQYLKLFNKENLNVNMNLLKNDIYALGLTILSIECNTLSPDIDIDNKELFDQRKKYKNSKKRKYYDLCRTLKEGIQKGNKRAGA